LEEQPKILKVETGWISESNSDADSSENILDYNIYDHIPCWWRRVEEFLRLDIYLAWRAKLVENQYDIIYAGSEKVGIPLSFFRLQKPLVVVAHHMESPMKAMFTRITGIARKWAGLGYISSKSRDFFINYLGVPADRLFLFESAKYLDRAVLSQTAPNGPIMSIGVAKRDYNTLITALSDLPECETELFVSSKFGNELRDSIGVPIPGWVHLADFLPEDELMKRYRNTPFVIIPLENTTHNGAGISILLEAWAFGKAVITTKTGGMDSFVKDGETGILVPPNDVEAMRNAICRLWTQPELARRMGLAGRSYIEKHFDPVDVDEKISVLLNKIYHDTVSQV
jgi:glycosyltransferase involved in cell wall biosynthesis